MTSLRSAVVALSVTTALLALVVAPAQAGKTKDEMEALESDVSDLAAKVEQVSLDQAAILQSLSAIRDYLGMDRPGHRSPADVAADLDQMERSLSVLGTQQGDTASRVSVLQDKVASLYRQFAAVQSQVDALGSASRLTAVGEGSAAPTAAPGPALTAPPVTTGEPAASGLESPVQGASGPTAVPLVDPEELYQAARADFGRGSHALALEGFRQYLDLFPNSDLADNAQYWIAECRYAERDWQQALAAFEVVPTRWPDGDKVPDALYKKALCLLEMNRTADGIIQLQAVKDRHPDSEAARLSRQKLESLGLL